LRGRHICRAAKVKVVQSSCRRAACVHDEAMPNDSRFGRIGRSYPRHSFEPADVEQSSIGRFQVTAALLGLLSALGLIGWFLAR
jgi:hypothetical protein